MRQDVLRELADGYHERATRSLGTRQQDGRLVKVYAIEAPGRHVGAAEEQAALELARLDDDSTGLAVVIVHAGADGDYVIIQSWLTDYMTRLAVYAGPAGEPRRLRPAPPGFGPCVWEAAVLAHERATFVEHVLTGSGPIDRRVRVWADDMFGTRSPWLSAAPMRGDHVVLAPLDLAHVPDLLTATADDEVWRHLHLRRPADVTEMTAIVADALHDHQTGARVPWVQRDARTGAVVGTTSYYDISEGRGSVAIGHTIIGRPWWRTGLNTEAKLLLLTRAFDELSAERVEWHVDTDNERSHQAVLRLGATREGVIRHHHRRQSDGSLRDMALYSMTADEWPDARTRLNTLLRAHT